MVVKSYDSQKTSKASGLKASPESLESKDRGRATQSLGDITWNSSSLLVLKMCIEGEQ